MGTVLIEAYGKIYQCSYLFFQLVLSIQAIVMVACGWYIGNIVRKRRTQ